jgi:hypothetical protein
MPPQILKSASFLKNQETTLKMKTATTAMGIIHNLKMGLIHQVSALAVI